MKILLNLYLLLATFAFAQENIVSIIVEGNKTISKDTVLFYLNLEEGKTLDEEALRKNFKKLVETNLFSDIRITKEDVPGGVKLLITVVERPIIKEIKYEGNKALSKAQIKEKLTLNHVKLQVSAALRKDILQEAKKVIVDAYKALGYPNAQVDVEVEPLEGVYRRVIFRVNEGTKLRIKGIHFAGNTVFSEGKLRRTLKKTKKWNWISAISKHGIYNPDNLKEDYEKIKALYRKKGYKDIKLGEVKMEMVDLKKGKKGVILTIPIEEGKQYHIAGISIEGATIFKKETLMKKITFETGQILNFQQLKEAMEGINEMYTGRGYLFAQVYPEFQEVPKDPQTLQVVIHIKEGEQFRLGRIEFTGNTRTLDKVLRRELQVREGEVFNAPMFRRGIFRLNQLGYFKLNEEKPVDIDVDDEKHKVHVTVHGREAARNDVQFSAGYSELDGFFGQVYFNTRNFLGRGERFTIGYQSGRRRDYYELVYASPWFLDKPHILSVSLYSRTLDFLDFDRESKGFSLGYGLRLGYFATLNLYFNNESIYAQWSDAFKYTIDDEGNRLPNSLYQDIDARGVSLTPSFFLDRRDDPFDPFRGSSISFSLKYSGGPLGGDIHLIKPQVELTHYHPTSRHHTFAGHLELGKIFSTKGEIPFYERYFLGGERTLRGFGIRSIRPENEAEGIIGGNRYILLNLESIWRIEGPFRLVAFFDIGQTYGEWEPTDLSRLRYSTGIELRIFIPTFMAPLRFIYGINLDPLPGESRSDFQFTIGTNF